MACARAAGPARRVRWGIALALCLCLELGCHRSTKTDATDSTAASASASNVVADLPPPPPPTPAPPPPTPPPTPDQAGTCPAGSDDTLGLVVSPIHAFAGAPVRILAATLVDPEPLAFRLETPKGEPIDADVVYRGGIPAMTVARLLPKHAGEIRVVVGRRGKALRCTTFHVHAHPLPQKPRDAREEAVWSVVRNWSRAEEALYS